VIAARLEQAGASVLSVDLDPDPAGPGVPHQADLTHPADNADAVAAALEQFKRLDVVVPNAGVQHVAPIEEFPVERFQHIVALLLTSPFLLEVILAPHAVKQLIEPAEVADVVAFLAGPSGRSFTGVPVTMDYGWTAR
jgi:3-hydroxybutyrate dehydrogenase